jgi:hypothetical protein
MRGKRSCSLAAGAIAVLAALAITLPAQASAPRSAGGVRFSISLSRNRLSYRGAPAILSIRMRTSARGQTAGIGLNASGWPDRNVIGSPVDFGAASISGAGKITGGFATSGGGFGAGPHCVRGPLEPGGGGQVVSLPPNSVTVLSYPVHFAAPPWPQVRPRVGVWAYVPANGAGARAYQLGSRRLRAAGRTGVRISLSVKRGAVRVNRYGQAVIPQGANVLIAGSTDPAVPGARVWIAAKTGARHPQHVKRIAIGSARTSSDGSFQIWWRPPHRQGYLLVARLPHPAAAHLPDRGCDLSLDVR